MPILPPIWASRPAARRRCAVSAVVVDLPLVPVMATNGASVRCARRSRQNSSMSPITSTPAARASATDPVRRRMRQRHAGRQHQRRDARPIDLAQIGGRNAGAGRLRDGLGVVVPADDVGAAGEQRARARQPRAAQAEHRDLLSGKDGDRDHGVVREAEGAASSAHQPSVRDAVTATSASTARRAPARPRRSRSGSRSAARSSRAARNGGGSAPSRNTRLPVSLNETTCTITDTASSTNSPPTTASTISCLVATAIAPIMPPSASEPVSPMKIEAGGALNHRKPSPAPITAPHSTASSPVPAT